MSATEQVRVGVIGCGAISGAYLGMAKNFPAVEIAAVADLDMSRAQAAAEKYSIPRALSVDDLIDDEEIEIVLNLTIPKAHVPVALRALKAGKHTFCEKPLGIDRAEGKKVIALAKKKNLRVGCAPDTFMGAGIQTARKLIDDGAIGRPVAFTAFMQCRGHETWHPNPQFYYEVGGGPMFDMGPYYLTALLNLLGPVKRISGLAAIAIPDRTITSEALKGTKIRVETPDHITGLIEFENGAIGTIIQSFAVLEGGHSNAHPIIINGTDGAMHVPDPNGFDGTVKLRKVGEKEPVEMPHTFVTGYGRSVGLADMAVALRSGREHRASGEQALAVLDLMAGFLDSSKSGKTVKPTTEYHRPKPMPAELPFGTLDT
jgi:predicted dehydrogenase